MKKLVTLAFITASMLFSVPLTEARSGSENNSATVNYQRQDRDRQNRRNNDRRYNDRRNTRVRTYYQTRIVRYGKRVYRETYRITVLPNGRINTKLVSRVRIR